MKLSISLLGHFLATIDEQNIPESRTQKIEALLIYLVVEHKYAHRREKLIGLLFPEMLDEDASTNFRQTLTRLRRAINDEETSPPFLTISRESIQFNRQSEHWCDLFEFDALLSGCNEHRPQRVGKCPGCMARVHQAIKLYKGQFLLDFSLSDSADFEDWVAVQRERIRQKVLVVLNDLIDFHTRRGEYGQAILNGQRQLEIEPCREETHQLLMRLFARIGQRTQALVQYKSCEDALQHELDVEPLPETTALRDQIAELENTRSYNLSRSDEIFIGRSDELAHIYLHFTNDATRLLTLVGGGGIGKTRLALEAGWRIANEYLGPFMHGVYFISLATVRASSDVEKMLLIAVADSLGISLVGIRSPLDIIIGYLHDKELLLIVDNCEEAGDAIKILSRLLNHAPGLQILATSREPLDLSNEFLIHLDGLFFPTDDQQIVSPPVDGIREEFAANDRSNFVTEIDATWLKSYPAVQLFSYHAQRVNVDFSITELDHSELQAVVRICQVCAGTPLALEMAAVWVQTLPCEEIADEIERNLDILQSNNREHQPRHRSIRAVFDYSWQRLTEAERLLFAQLSVFQGGFDLEAAQQVAKAKLSVLASLVRKSLIHYANKHTSKDPTVNKQVRYAFHPLLHQYAAEKLTADLSEKTQMQQQHGTYYCAWLEKQSPLLKGGEQQKAMNTIGLEFDNVRQAWHWAVANQREELIAYTVEGITDFYELRGLFKEGEGLLRQATEQLQATQRLNEKDETAIVVAKTLTRQGRLNFLLGQAWAFRQKPTVLNAARPDAHQHSCIK